MKSLEAAMKTGNEKFTAVESEDAELKAGVQALKNAIVSMQEKGNSGVRAAALEQ
jgi:hypothetical protein